MPKLTLDEKSIRPYWDKILALELIVPEWFWELTLAEVARCYNGVGSDLTAKPLRKALTCIFLFAICSVIIHDVIWSHIEAYGLTLDDFRTSNRNLKINAREELKSQYSRFDPRYWWRYSMAWVAEQACNRLGKKAWNSHKKKEKTNE